MVPKAWREALIESADWISPAKCYEAINISTEGTMLTTVR